jgi:DNA polymerase-3 subunit alpha
MAKSFVHLHTHSEYSMLDGASRMPELVAAAKADGQPAIGVTDHGNMYGVLPLYKEANAQGIKPIIGMEAYMAETSRFDRPLRKSQIDDSGGNDDGGKKLYYHLTLLCENETGYKNLIQLSSKAFLEGYYYKPRVDYELLAAHSKGLIATSGCLGGLVLQALLRNDIEEAISVAGRLQDIFGKNNFFIELQDHGLPEQIRTNPLLINIAKYIKAPLLATNDSHYTHKSAARAHDALLCIQTNAKLSDPNRFHFDGEEHYLKSAAEMRSLFAEVPEACDSTLLIAERSDIKINFNNPSLPEFPIPAEFLGATYDQSAANYLRHLVYQGARERYPELTDKIKDRIDYELQVVTAMGFPAYFLVVWDLIRYAKENNIRVGPGRGSAAGSVVSYCLGIVNLDPLKYDLLFERFLNPGRKQMPDIDMDFDERYRGDMIKYASERYGEDHVAQIITFSTIKARAAVRDAARVLGMPYAVGDKIAKAMPAVVMGRDTSLNNCLFENPGFESGYAAASDLRKLIETDTEAREVVDLALGIENLRRQDGIHAAAVVITKDPLTTYIPIQRKGPSDSSSPIVTQYEMHGIEELGLLKMDFLGLKTLAVIDRTLELISLSQGKTINIDTIPLDDPKTFELLRRADTYGVFQLEGAQMRALMTALAPTTFDDIAALVALYRPGPMAANMHNDYVDRKANRKPITYLHPDQEELLSSTYGLMIYQEQMMRVAQKFAGYSLEQAENLRKATGKKDRDLIASERTRFIEGCISQGYEKSLGVALFDIIEPFADYAFNKSHSYGYGLVAYQTAWLKANYRVEFMASLLTSVKDDKDKTALYLADAARSGIQVRVPNVNLSAREFSVATDSDGTPYIAFGLSAIRNVGESVANAIVDERTVNGPFETINDFFVRSSSAVLNKRVVGSLIKAGAFDSFGLSRQGLFEIHEDALASIQKYKKLQNKLRSDTNLLNNPVNSAPELPEISTAEWSQSEKLNYEKEMLGRFVSDHPMSSLMSSLAERGYKSIVEIKENLPIDSNIKIVGVPLSVNVRRTKKGDSMATLTIEDFTSSINAVVFPRSYAQYDYLLSSNEVLQFSGKLDATREDEIKLICQDIRPYEETLPPPPLPSDIILSEDKSPLAVVKLAPSRSIPDLLHVLRSHPGKTPVKIYHGSRGVILKKELNIDLTEELLLQLKGIFGDQIFVKPIQSQNNNQVIKL